jgi:peptidylprolyl isomerase
MRLCGALAAVVLAAVAIGCGDGAETTGPGQGSEMTTSPKKIRRTAYIPPGSYGKEGSFAAVVVKKSGAEAEITPPHRPPPEKLLVRDLEEGSGPPARRGEIVAVRYTGALYETGEIEYGGKTNPFPLGSAGLGEGFEKGIEGMRVGGRREVVMPSRLHGGTGAYDYVIELIRTG